MVDPLFQELLRCARDAGIEVRHAPLGGAGGGLAVLRGKRQLFIDTDADPEDQLDRTVAALAKVDAVMSGPLRDDVRQLLRRSR